MWTYEIATGSLFDSKGTRVGKGYSGYDNGDGRIEPGEGWNRPEMHEVKGVGPIPIGRWRFSAPFFHKDCGPYTLRLYPTAGTDTHGRSGFLVHGDSLRLPGTASHGCIILPRELRMMLWESGDHEIEVVSGNGEPAPRLA